MSFFSISSPNLSFIPPTVSEKIDAEVLNMISANLSDQRNSSNAGRFKSTNQRLASHGFSAFPRENHGKPNVDW